MILYDIKVKAETYKKELTFSFIQERINSQKVFAYNGFITEVEESFIKFFDVVIEKEFPIMFSGIQTLEVSRRKEITQDEALLIFKLWKEKNGI